MSKKTFIKAVGKKKKNSLLQKGNKFLQKRNLIKLSMTDDN